jgi:NitT/TauT family transport system substrate-binding protein
MSRFKIQPHNRLQEWVAEEKGYFRDVGLEYEFHMPGGADAMGIGRSYHLQGDSGASVRSESEAPAPILSGALETMEAGRTCDISSACHWAVNVAASAHHGQMWGRAYSVAPSGIYVAPDSPVRKPAELAGREVGVGYHSGSHFSALQALEALFDPDKIGLKFIGSPNDRVAQLLDGRIDAANVFGMQTYIVEQQGFRKVVDTTFMIGFLIQPGAEPADVAKYFAALERAQGDIDADHQQYTHYYLREMADEFKPLVDVRAFGPGERVVFSPYTREMYERAHRWVQTLNLFSADQLGAVNYKAAVVGT